MAGFFDFEDFSWGLILGLFVVVALLGIVFAFAARGDFFDDMVPVYTLLGFTFSIAAFEAGLIVYMHGVNRGTFHKGEMKKNLLLELNALKNAREDVEKGFMKREMDEASRDEMVRDLKQKELEIKNRLAALEGGEFEIDMEEEGGD